MFYDKIELGLDNIKRACEVFGDPQNKLRIIHIAGTNAKGSVGSFISANLTYQGYRVGHFSSPCVTDKYDIWKINNVNISENDYNILHKRVKDLCPYLTQFEEEALIAFQYFYEQKCDYAIIETGMGGRLDATNIVDKKLLCVITPIAVDHTKFLGNTLYDIAREKAGIIKNNRCVSAQQQSEAKRALSESSDNIIFAQVPANIRYLYDKTIFDYKDYKNIEIPLLGKNQCENAALAIEALEAIDKFDIDGFKNTIWHCRFERINNFILDAAHNPHGIHALEENINIYLKNKSITFITAVFKDKDYKKAAYIAKYADKIYTVESDNPRCLSAEKWAEELRAYCKNTTPVKDIKKAVRLSLNDEAVVIFGTFSIMNEAYKEVISSVQ